MFLVFSLSFSLLKAVFAQWPQAVPTGFVNDYSNLFSAPVRQSLEQKLESFQSTAEITVVTIPSLNGDTIENYAQKLFSVWKIGDQSKKNGLLLLISRDNRQIRLEVGYGLEPYLTDGQAGEILRNYATPFLKNNNYDQAAISTIDQLTHILSSQIQPSTSKSNQNLPNLPIELFLVLIPFLSYLVSFMARSKSIWAGGILGLALGFLFFQFWGAILFCLLGLLLDYILSNNYNYFVSTNQTTTWKPTHGGFWGRSSNPGFWKSSGNGFGGFGGGSSGGGGASSGW